MAHQCRIACGLCCIDWPIALPEKYFLSKKPHWTDPCPYLTSHGCKFSFEQRPHMYQTHSCTISDICEKYKIDKTREKAEADPKSKQFTDQLYRLHQKIIRHEPIDPKLIIQIDVLKNILHKE
jgi:hypothetical protein